MKETHFKVVVVILLPTVVVLSFGVLSFLQRGPPINFTRPVNREISIFKNFTGIMRSMMHNITSGNKYAHTRSKTIPKNNNAPHKPCFRQVQVFRGSPNPQKPKEYVCPGVDCGIRHVTDTSMVTMKKSDAVVWFHRSSWNWDEIHKQRPPGQKWIFYTLESPHHTSGRVIPPDEYYHNSYDYIMSYRTRETTIYSSYGHFDTSQPGIPENDSRNWAEGRTGLVAWMASNCGTASWRRTDFVKKLSSYISVDMYGACGNKKCPRNNEECFNILRKHKFYLALENSECRDYVTEKLWQNSYLLDLVPVVYGPPREDYEHIAPPNSFIHLQDFSSMQELADYLKKVDSNDTLYNSYFEWKKRGVVVRTGEGYDLGPENLCQAVKLITEDEKSLANGTYSKRKLPDWKSWWTGSCRHPSGFPN